MHHYMVYFWLVICEACDVCGGTPFLPVPRLQLGGVHAVKVIAGSYHSAVFTDHLVCV